jgi:transposase-like protein
MHSSKMGKWSVDHKVDWVLKGLSGRSSVTEICREAGVSPVNYCQWRDQFLDAGRACLACNDLDDCTLEERARQLEIENANLRRQLKILRELCLAE